MDKVREDTVVLLRHKKLEQLVTGGITWRDWELYRPDGKAWHGPALSVSHRDVRLWARRPKKAGARERASGETQYGGGDSHGGRRRRRIELGSKGEWAAEVKYW